MQWPPKTVNEERDDWKQRALDAQALVEAKDKNLAMKEEWLLEWKRVAEELKAQIPAANRLCSELEQWKQRAETAEKERDSLASMSDAIQAKARVIEAENVELKKACAEMREAIEMLRDFWEDYPKDRAVALNAMASTAGTGYLSPAEVKEKVKPLVDALQFALETPMHGKKTREALDHARKEGLI